MLTAVPCASEMGCGLTALPGLPIPVFGGLSGLPAIGHAPLGGAAGLQLAGAMPPPPPLGAAAGGHLSPGRAAPPVGAAPLGASLPLLASPLPQPHLATPPLPLPAAHGAGSGAAAAGEGLLLAGHTSNDSAMLAAIMDQILDDEELLSDTGIGRQLLGTPTGSPLLAPPRLSSGGAAAGAAGSASQAVAWPQAWKEENHAAAPADAAAGVPLGMVPVEAHCGFGSPAVSRAVSCSVPLGAHPAAPHLPPRTPCSGGAAWGERASAPADSASFYHPSRRVSTGDLPPVTPQPQQPQAAGPAQPPGAMRALCVQLQQENMLLMQRVASLQERLVSPGAPEGLPALPLPLTAGAASPGEWHGAGGAV
jgi:hypothetical protein